MDNTPVLYKRSYIRKDLSSQGHTRRWRMIILALVWQCLLLGLGIFAYVLGDRWWTIGSQMSWTSIAWGIDARPIGPDGTWQITWVFPSSLANDASIAIGDIVQSADGRIPENATQIDHARSLELLPSGGREPRHIVWQPLHSIPPEGVFWLISGCLSLVLGLIVYLHALNRAQATRFFLFSTLFGFAASSYLIVQQGNLAFKFFELSCSSIFLPGALAVFLWSLFSEQPRGYEAPVGKTSFQFTLPVWKDAFPLLAGLIPLVLFSLDVSTHAPIWRGLLYPSVALLWVLASVICLFLFIRAGKKERQQGSKKVRTILLSLLLAVLPPLLLTVLPDILGDHRPLVLGEYSGLSLLILPLTWAWMVLRTRLLQVDSFIYRSVHIALWGASLLLVGIMLSNILEGAPSPVAGVAIAAIAGMAPALFLATRWFTESWLFPQVRRYRQILASMEQAEQTRLQPQSVAEHIITKIHLVLPVACAQVFLPDEGGEVFTPLLYDASQPCHALRLDDSQILLRLAHHRKPTLIEPASRFDQQAPEIPIRLLLPIHTQQGLIGILGLSAREDGLAFSSSDLTLLQRLAASITLPLDYALTNKQAMVRLERLDELELLRATMLQLLPSHINGRLQQVREGIGTFLAVREQMKPDNQGSEGARLQQLRRMLQEAEEGLSVLVEQGTDEINLSQVPIAPVLVTPVIEQVIKALKLRPDCKGYTIRSNVSGSFTVQANAHALFRALYILFLFSLQESPPGRPLQVIGEETSRENLQDRWPMQQEHLPETPRSIHLVWRDWGPALSTADQVFLFNRNRPAVHWANTRSNLPRCKQLLEAQGGYIWVENSPHAAQRSFHIVLPQGAYSSNQLVISTTGPTPIHPY